MPLNYQLIRQRRKTLALTIQNGQLIVKAPRLLSQEQIDRFVESKRDWIEKKLAEKRRAVSDQIIDGKVFFLGAWLEAQEVQDSRSIVFIREKGLEIHGRTPAARQKVYGRFMDETILYYLNKRLKELGISDCSCNCRRYKSRWGCCNRTKRHITMNRLAACLPLINLQAIIDHEITHLKVANHGPGFYKELLKICPDYRQRQKEMRSYAIER